ncbi:HAMP domain-containing protein [Chelativorans sp. ZYF759]|uniref:sensor histidine kinase n=1 Tax=Chelativorans sp. ZYF759 TaxID=2692213 RepID=UPI00145C4684|nr:ATP-binding protein [Chelativorans sp. ZYF759]NMG38995.1 HAMP domain-containing protein [Chelativorans sp. ZYF759]
MTARLPAIFKTTATRLSALYLLLFALCAMILVFYTTSLSVRMLTGQLQETISDEVPILGRAYQRGGVPLLVRFVEQRSRQPGANLYLLADPQGRILAGNVEALQPGVLDIEGWSDTPFLYSRFAAAEAEAETANEGHRAVAFVMRLPNQMILLVGRDLGEAERLRFVMRRALILALGFMGLGALIIWYVVGRRALRRIDRVSDAGRRIMAGDLTGRLPISGAGDEFDRLSENLNSMLGRIASLNEGLKQVSDNIAHDLKTPLTRMRNRAEAALAGDKRSGEYRKVLEATITEADQLIRTFNAILMISRLEAGYSAEQTGSIDLTAIIADVVDLYEPLAEENGVAFVADAAANASVTGNRELIGQALSNVVDNAIKYSQGHGENPTVRVALRRVADAWRIDVEDSGPGIAEADRARATERFVRLEDSRSQPGSGLGLSLAKAIMGFHGGGLELSGRDPGLCVSMTFPDRKAD